jgi:S-adenosyl-L-methionine hydrolase (adenosine-forming)
VTDKSNRVITFTSDFGSADGYVGIVKGVIKTINRKAHVIDLSHDIESFQISTAAWIIYNAYDYFPQDTIHLVVVDPGVGSDRRAVVLRQNETIFVGPDNGVFSMIIQDPLGKRSGKRQNGADKNVSPLELEAFELSQESQYYSSVSSTFHARDIFGKVVAHLSSDLHGFVLKKFATPIDATSLVVDEKLKVETTPNAIRGKVAHIDHFGNLITSIPASAVRDSAICSVNGTKIGSVRTSYHSVGKGEVVAIRGSHGFLEIAAREARADVKTNVESGADVTVEF